MTAALLSIGTELTRGELTNTNARWLAEQLTSVGFVVTEHATVDDDMPRIIETLSRLAQRARVVVCTGGLGPTSDDLTTEAVAKALGVKLVRDDESAEGIRRRYAKLQREMPVANLKQADFPEGATILPNPEGTAPGFGVVIGETHAFFMPGVPREMQRMFHESVLPAIASFASRDSYQVHLRTFGMTESQVAEKIADLESLEPGVTLGYRAHIPEIEVKVLARSSSPAEAEDRARRIAELVRERLGDVVYGGRDDTFAGSVGRILRDKHLTLAVAESCTGGMIGSMVTSVPGSSDYLLLDAVTYSNASKESVLGVSADTMRAHGSVSVETAAAMAEGAMRLADSDIAVSVTGIAGPGGGSDDKPVGTVCFGLARKGAPTYTKRMLFPGDRERVRVLSSYVALALVRRSALGKLATE